MPVRLYQFDDSLAPLHPSATRGSLAALLRACLVSGYGTKEPAGWEELYPATAELAVFRPLSGLERQCYQIDDNLPDADVAILYGSESMSDVSTRFGQWASQYFGKHYSPAASQQWYLIADERTCWLFLQTNGGAFVAHGFGAFDSLLPDNPWASFIAGHSLTTALPTSASGTSLAASAALGAVATQPIKIHRSSISSSPPGLNLGIVGCASGIDGHGTFGKGPSSYAPVADWYLQPVFLSEYATDAYCRHIAGVFRGLYYPLTFRPVTSGVTITINGRNYLAINTTLGGQLLVDLTGWSA